MKTSLKFFLKNNSCKNILANLAENRGFNKQGGILLK